MNMGQDIVVIELSSAIYLWRVKHSWYCGGLLIHSSFIRGTGSSPVPSARSQNRTDGCNKNTRGIKNENEVAPY